MAVLGVNEELLKELEAMGFPPARATRALHRSGNSSIEAAIDWIVDHENDPDIDEMPRVSMDLDVRSPEPLFVTEEMRAKAQKLRDSARKNTLEERNSEREREKERIRAGKQLLEAKIIAEENERKRLLAWRKADKDETKRARERIIQKLKTDKLERRQRLGLGTSSENHAPSRDTLPLGDDKLNAPASSVAKAGKMRECLRSIRRNHKADHARVRMAFETLLIYVGNVARNPDVEKFRRIRIGNPKFQERVGSLEGGLEFLELCGFEKTDGADFLSLPRDKVDMAVLHSAGSQLKSALTNPYFGLFSDM